MDFLDAGDVGAADYVFEGMLFMIEENRPSYILGAESRMGVPSGKAGAGELLHIVWREAREEIEGG